jgi:hypothetical protein
LRRVALQVWKKLHVLVVPAEWRRLFLQKSLSIYVNPRVILDMLKIFGMGNFSVITSRRGLTYTWVSGSASVCSARWGFGGENPGL